MVSHITCSFVFFHAVFRDHFSGKFIDAKGASSCDSCAAGRFAAENNETSCSLCPSGHYQPAIGQPSRAGCEKGRWILHLKIYLIYGLCILRQFINANMKRVTICIYLSGKYTSKYASLSCEFCEAGQYAATVNQVLCSACSPGHFSAAGQFSCEKCDLGNDTISGEWCLWFFMDAAIIVLGCIRQVYGHDWCFNMQELRGGTICRSYKSNNVLLVPLGPISTSYYPIFMLRLRKWWNVSLTDS